MKLAVRGRVRLASMTSTSARRWTSRIAIVALIAAVLPGCSGRGSYITGGPSSSQLKTSLSHLEYENDQLKTQVARLKEENRSIEDRLVQEQIHSGDLTARLDNARNILRDRGYEFENMAKVRDKADDDFGASPSRPRTLPAGRTTPKRKPPTAQISGAADEDDDEIPPLTIGGDRNDGAAKTRSARPKSPPRRADDSVSLNVNDDFRWLPVANGEDPPKP